MLIGFFGSALYFAVDKYEPDRTVAFMLKFLVALWAAAAVLHCTGLLATDFSGSTIHWHEKAPAVRPRLVDLEWAKHTPVSSVPSLDGKCVVLE